jgi:mRNA interferase MazF
MTEAAAALVAGLRRGTVVTVASAGVYSGKPRPAVVVQADRWLQAHPSVTLCPLTSTLIEAPLVRIAVAPSPRNGLQKPSQLMVDKLFSVPIQALGAVVGQLEPQVLIELDLALRGLLDLSRSTLSGSAEPAYPRWGAAHTASASGTRPRTSIWPVK